MSRTYKSAHQSKRLSKYSNRKLFVIVGLTIVVVASIPLFFLRSPGAKHSPTPTKNKTQPTTGQQSPAGFNKQQYSTDDPASIWVVINKKRALNPPSYTPADLVVPAVPLRVPGNESMQVRKVTATALEQLFAGAKTAGYNLMLSSGYRSYSYQVNLYGGYVKSIGQTEADKTSARPGHSEHQTGLAADIEPSTRKCEVAVCFADTPEGIWLAAHAYQYGFIIRYTKDKVNTTGYEYEPWHVRYVGADLASELHAKGIETLEEFFSLPGGKDY